MTEFRSGFFAPVCTEMHNKLQDRREEKETPHHCYFVSFEFILQHVLFKFHDHASLFVGVKCEAYF